MKKITLIVFSLLINFTIQAQTFVFVGSYNVDKTKEGIYVFELDTLNGTLTKVSSVKDILNPSFFTLTKDGKYLYSCTDTRTKNLGSVSCFEFNATSKSLSLLNTQKTGGENPVYVALDKSEGFLLNANYNDGSISVYPINTDKSIGAVSQFISYQDSSINKQRQERSHIHSTVFSPDYNYVFLPDLGADKIRVYKFDTSQNQPLQIAEDPFTKTVAGSGPRHFVFHPNKKFAYCIEELSGTINAYRYKNGRLDSIQRISTHKKKHDEQLSSADIHISPDGRFLYASNRSTENNIAIFSISENGTLKPIAHQSTFGKTPRIFGLDEQGKFLIVANQSTGNIIVFKRNAKTGLLKKVKSNIHVPNASCVQIKQYN